MAAIFMKFLLLLLTMTSATLKGGKAWSLFPPKTTVQIINNFSPPQDLTLHCKSKDDDLHEHTIKVGEMYQFKFRPNPLLDATLFFCSFRWPSDPSLHYFDIYVEARDKECTLCSWKLSQLGLCTFDVTEGVYTCYPWNFKPPLSLSPLGVAISNGNTSHKSHL